MTRTAQDFAPGQYLLALSPVQLATLLGPDIAATVGDHFCRISPQDPTILDLWLTTSQCAGGTYERNPVARPADWKPFLVEGVYYDNNQEYAQDVLATDEADAKDQAQRVAFASAQGSDYEYDGSEMIDPDSIEVTPSEEAGAVPTRNANRYPEQAAYLAAYVLTDPRYQDRFLSDDGPRGDEPVQDGFRLVAEAAVAFLNELTREDADGLQDEEAYRFVDEFFAANA